MNFSSEWIFMDWRRESYFLKIWESYMVLLRLKELSEMKTKKQFKKVDIFSRESETGDEFYETESKLKLSNDMYFHPKVPENRQYMKYCNFKELGRYENYV